jgi:hypothetical protein
MGHPYASKLAPAAEAEDVTRRYIAHLEETVRDLRGVRDRMADELKKLRADLWHRGMVAAEHKAKADAERENARLLFQLLVEAEARSASE